MTADGSVSHWIQLLRQGDHTAAQPLWERYFTQMQAVARQKLKGRAPALADAEDVALSAFDSFCRSLERGRFPQLNDRDDLWRLLVVITARKVAHLLRGEQCQKRGGGQVCSCGIGPDSPVLDEVIGPELTPEFAAQLAEAYEQLLTRLPSRDLEQVALWKLEGYTNAEIAGKLGCAPRTVDRKLHLIRRLWQQEPPS
jgi:DNA-directed RNA polymerase specialized sigma24 family protein